MRRMRRMHQSRTCCGALVSLRTQLLILGCLLGCSLTTTRAVAVTCKQHLLQACQPAHALPPACCRSTMRCSSRWMTQSWQRTPLCFRYVQALCCAADAATAAGNAALQLAAAASSSRSDACHAASCNSCNTCASQVWLDGFMPPAIDLPIFPFGRGMKARCVRLCCTAIQQPHVLAMPSGRAHSTACIPAPLDCAAALPLWIALLHCPAGLCCRQQLKQRAQAALSDPHLPPDSLLAQFSAEWGADSETAHDNVINLLFAGAGCCCLCCA